MHRIEAHVEDELTTMETTVKFNRQWDKKQRKKLE